MLSSIQTLDIGYNRLTGKLPRSLQNCSSLQFLSVDNNRIKDTFPFWLKALPDLQILTLRSNEFYGPISPPHQGPLGFPELRIFEISNNKFTGSLPPNLQYKGLHMEQGNVLTSYATIDFSGNRLEGQIPESIGLLKALIRTQPVEQRLHRPYSSVFANLSKLESLDLSSNNSLGLFLMDSGASRFWRLCGLPLKKLAFSTNAPQQQPEQEKEEEEEQVLSWKAVAIGYGLGVLFGLSIAQVIASYKPEWLSKIIGPTKRRNR
ncbi:unnamed protein product [Microthlaspi erraticum]|uniref:Leucine-rich repeat-containing N-terminal plant-type domain-containing protein n=1 Tax=Microthlaspi erraticum TaxID=1685480 RepID=A0A6D2K5N2_9BRAS|nr:unnamed protein product [Microthlaspi erraticum]